MTVMMPLHAFRRPVERGPEQSKPDLPRWAPGLLPGLLDASLHAEIFAASHDGAGAALALALALDRMAVAAADPAADTPDERPWLWVQDKAAQRLTGQPYRPGLPPALRRRLVHVSAKTPEDALFALEEGLRCRDMAFVLGEVAGNPRALDFTASRRLSLTAEKHGVPLWLVRLDSARDLSSARQRWQARSAPSARARWNPAAPGTPAWQAELFRARAFPPGVWVLGEAPGGRLREVAAGAGKPSPAEEVLRA